ncbi:NnrS family protein [Nitrogeniibacter aestuarii]|uniref:NnrS family protein n=1 Tax=Nitrogeniibacter aestuarii TaxID=2815343 RepID=UPI001D0F59E4|nr:NnrS family protein [Nitrogeniibacter aestuarii]
MAFIALGEPTIRLTPNQPGWTASFAMAFRPLYLLAALFVTVAVSAWSLGYSGGDALPGLYWHGHEMIWGYAGAIIVGFLLTAAATWTGQPPTRGLPLAGLTALWVAARVAAALEDGAPIITAALSVTFFLQAAIMLARPVLRVRSQRNYLLPVLLTGFGLANLVYLLSVAGRVDIDPMRMLASGLLLVAAFIVIIGLRVIPFFTHRALGVPQVSTPAWAGWASVTATVALAALAAFGGPPLLVDVLGVGTAVLNLGLLLRSAHRRMWGQPLLWVLYVGYAFTAVGLGVLAMALAGREAWLSAGVHLVGVGGIGVLTLGMMSRTALGHTGRPLKLTRDMPVAFALMVAAAAVRLVAAWPSGGADPMLITVSGLMFAAAMVIFIGRYGRWLISTRADGMPG